MSRKDRIGYENRTSSGACDQHFSRFEMISLSYLHDDSKEREDPDGFLKSFRISLTILI